MNKHTANGIIGRLHQVGDNLITFPNYRTEGGRRAERKKVIFWRDRTGAKGTRYIDVLVQNKGDNFRLRTMRVDRIHPETVIIDGRRRQRYFIEVEHRANK